MSESDTDNKYLDLFLMANFNTLTPRQFLDALKPLINQQCLEAVEKDRKARSVVGLKAMQEWHRKNDKEVATKRDKWFKAQLQAQAAQLNAEEDKK